MNAERVIVTSESGALLVATVGDLIAQGRDRTLPKPRVIVGILIFYGMLGLVAGLGAGVARFAAASGVVAFLVTLVGTGVKGTGAGGHALIDFFNRSAALVTGGAGGGGNGVPAGTDVNPSTNPKAAGPPAPRGR